MICFFECFDFWYKQDLSAWISLPDIWKDVEEASEKAKPRTSIENFIGVGETQKQQRGCTTIWKKNTYKICQAFQQRESYDEKGDSWYVWSSQQSCAQMV